MKMTLRRWSVVLAFFVLGMQGCGPDDIRSTDEQQITQPSSFKNSDESGHTDTNTDTNSTPPTDINPSAPPVVVDVPVPVPAVVPFPYGRLRGGSSRHHGERETYSVSGTIVGLNNQDLSANDQGLQLRNNGRDTLYISSSATEFYFDEELPNGAAYNVTVFAQPHGQTCVVTDGVGNINEADVTNVLVTCTDNPLFNVSGVVSGLNPIGTLDDTPGLTLHLNNGETLPIYGDGNFTFSSDLPSGTPYSVTVETQPYDRFCTVTNGVGVIGNSDVTNVSINCVYSLYTVGGTLNSQPNIGLQLSLNGGSTIALFTIGGFTFPTSLPTGSPYTVTVFTQPIGQECNVVNGSGIISNSNITNVIVACFPAPVTN